MEFIIVGLGNPGREYENTRHNAGFMALDALAKRSSIKVDRVKWNALTGVGEIGGRKVMLMKPQTYMNNSGEAVSAAMRFYKLGLADILVMVDDVNLDIGVIRIRKKGSDGGQKGMRSIIGHCGGEDIERIKVGVGKKPHPEYDMVEWVLSKFRGGEIEGIEKAAEDAAAAAEMIVKGEVDAAMNKYSR